MGVRFWDSYCSDKPTAPYAHHWIAVEQLVDRGLIFHCKYCLRSKWLPLHLEEATRLSNLIRKFGPDEGYRLMLKERPAAHRLVVELQDLWVVRKVISKEQYLKVF